MEKKIIALIQQSGRSILHTVFNLCQSAIKDTSDEVAFFQKFFPAMESYLNQVNINPLLRFKCKTIEIHKKPIVKYGDNQKCELGDYFVNVKYENSGEAIGSRLVIYQVKYTKKSTWGLNKKQLLLLSNWPTFSFGKQGFGTNTFTLNNTTNDLGTYSFIGKPNNTFTFPAAIVQNIQKTNSLNSNNLCGIYPYILANAIYHQLIWKYGEPITENTNHKLFLETLYRYVRFAPDPPDEFKGYMINENDKKTFWGIEIVASMNRG